MPDDLWTEVPDIVWESGIKTIHMENKCKKAKWLSEEALQTAVKRQERRKKQKKRSKLKQRRKLKIFPFEGRVPNNSKER